MGYDDTGVLTHTEINARPLATTFGTFTLTPDGMANMSRDITFTGFRDGRDSTLMTITSDGQLLPGPGLTAEVATQHTAALLVQHFATEINRKIHAAQDEAADCKRKLIRAEAELMAVTERSKEFEWQASDANRKLGELMLRMVDIPPQSD